MVGEALDNTRAIKDITTEVGANTRKCAAALEGQDTKLVQLTGTAEATAKSVDTMLTGMGCMQEEMGGMQQQIGMYLIFHNYSDLNTLNHN